MVSRLVVHKNDVINFQLFFATRASHFSNHNPRATK